MKSRALVVVAAASAALAVGALAGVAVASTSSAKITACTNKSGDVRALGTKVKCLSGETKVSWNSRGPVGATGATGARGPAGATTNPLKGVTVMVPGTSCPAGSTSTGTSYSAISSLMNTMGYYPYRVDNSDTYSGPRLTTAGQGLLSMVGCTFN